MNRQLVAILLTTIFFIAPLAGCFGDDEETIVKVEESFVIDYKRPNEAVLKLGNFTSFTLEGEGNGIMTEPDVFLFVNHTYVKSHSVRVDDFMVHGYILTTPYATQANITFMDTEGRTEIIQVPIDEHRHLSLIHI